MRIAIAQMNVTVGDLSGNVHRILEFAERARTAGADLMVTPELAVCGYPPEDLLLREDFMRSCAEAVDDLVRRVRGITLVVGHPRIANSRRYNSASVIRDGKVLAVYDKQNLPNYTVFDEERYFESAGQPCVFGACAINICADTWDAEAPRAARESGAKILLVPNASPYHLNKQEIRYGVMRERVAETGLTIVYVNLVGGQDELVFDGGSFVMNANGVVTHQLPAFEEALCYVDIVDNEPVRGEIASPLRPDAEVYSALELGVRDYVTKNGFPGVLVGISGGIDSALSLAIAADALGPKKVRAFMMPSQYTAAISRMDARAEAEALGVRYSEISIAPLFHAFLSALADEFEGREEDAAEENLQARIRASLLMAVANKTGTIVLTTGNKSELATGYATLYGDMAGGFGVLKDIDKRLVYRLARYRNSISCVIPQRVIDRAPSAELSPGQTDQDTLPPYPALDAILEAYIENDMSPADIVAQGSNRDDVVRVTRLIANSEFKRRQAPIGVRITSRGFGKDWRYPITNRFRHRVD